MSTETPTYRTIVKHWPRLAVAVSMATKGAKWTDGEHHPVVTRRQAEARALAIYAHPDGREGWTADALRQAIEVAS